MWSYWEGPSNKILEKCINSWYKHIPDWEIRILSKQDINEYNFKLPTTVNEINIDSTYYICTEAFG